jgi:DNA-binding CsgD family transcriptional regulator
LANSQKPGLTVREKEVLALIGEGKTSKEIALKLGVSVETVSNHRKHICRKLDLHSTAALVSHAAHARKAAAEA